MTLELLGMATEYVVNAPYFWGSMGFTTAIAMFSGVLLYDGQLSQVKKGLVTVLSYGTMLFWVTFSRVLDTTSHPEFLTSNKNPEYAYAGTLTLIFITLAWLLGLVLGVLVFRFKYKGGHYE